MPFYQTLYPTRTNNLAAYKRSIYKPKGRRNRRKNYAAYKRRTGSMPVRFRGTNRRRYNRTKALARQIAQVAENKFLTNKYENITPKPFVHLATDGYQLSCNLGDAVSDYSAGQLPLSSGLRCLNVLPGARDGDYIFGKKLVTRIGIYTKPISSNVGTDNLAPRS